MSKEGALHRLEAAFRDWYWETGEEMPDIGILCISLSREGCALQYLGQMPDAVIDWPALFSRIIQELDAGRVYINEEAEVRFNRRT